MWVFADDASLKYLLTMVLYRSPNRRYFGQQ